VGPRFDWAMVEPIDLAHRHVHPSRFSDLIASKYDGDPATVTLEEAVGADDPPTTRSRP
jgi:hypothetical protein